ncbi:MAG: hypothetical protein IT232_06235 [Flavobacteriales bacterium]|nr:hypothetical protein [Flavobacteriales bacterium]
MSREVGIDYLCLRQRTNYLSENDLLFVTSTKFHYFGAINKLKKRNIQLSLPYIMNETNRIILTIVICGFLTVIFMVLSDYYLRDRVFGANLLLWPISFITTTAIGLRILNKINSDSTSFIKSTLVASIVAIISSILFAFYWSRNMEGNQIENLIGSVLMTLPFNLMLALILGFLYRKK